MIRELYIMLFRRILTAFVLTLWGVSAFSQQDPLYSQYLNNLVSVNPAYAGSSEYLSALCLNRQQWTGLDGAPKTMSLSVNSPLKTVNIGLGLSFIHDVLGPVKQTGLYVDYAYHVKVTPYIKLAMGVKGGFNSYHMNLKDLISNSPDDHIASYGERKLFLPNFGVGLYLYSKRYYFGVSSPKLLENNLIEGGSTLGYANKEERHYFVMGALLFDLGDNLKMKPSFMSRVVSGAPVSVELTNSFIISDRLWLGAMYRFGDSVGGFVQFQVSQLRIGYAYDMTQSKLRNLSNGTHEIMISYEIGIRRKWSTPRMF